MTRRMPRPEVGPPQIRSEVTRVAVFATAFPPAFLGGGPVRTLEAMVVQAPATVSLSVLAPNRDLDKSDLAVDSNKWARQHGSDVAYVAVHKFSGLRKGLAMVKKTEPELIYLNSFFDARMSILPQILARLNYWSGARVLLAPRGEFNSGALQIRSRRKRLFVALYRAFGMQRQIAWHASTELEAASIRALWGHDSRVLVREDETSLPPEPQVPVPYEGHLRAAFLGRIVPNKGLLVILDALRDSAAHMTLDIYGPEEDQKYLRECRIAASHCPSNISVSFWGAIPPHEVRETLSAQDVLLMPTSGENFGHVIAESLSVSCPVICSIRTPWTNYLNRGGGRTIASLEPSDWRVAIEQFAAASPLERLERRDRAGVVYAEWRSAAKGVHVLEMMARASV
jgi:glycosyltransferase involved in cell wall biosynthesis